MNEIVIDIPIIPKPQHRVRFKLNGQTHKSHEQKANEYAIKTYLLKYKPKKPMIGAINVSCCVYLPIPKSWPKWKKELAKKGDYFHVVRPDADNYAKQILDCMTKVGFWKDDCQVVSLSISKYYDDGDGPRWDIIVSEYEQGKRGD